MVRRSRSIHQEAQAPSCGESKHWFDEAHRFLPRERACESVTNLFCILVGLHYAEKISFGILKIREIAHRGDWSFRHD